MHYVLLNPGRPKAKKKTKKAAKPAKSKKGAKSGMAKAKKKRSPAQKAATKRMIAANKKSKAKRSKPKKASKTRPAKAGRRSKPKSAPKPSKSSKRSRAAKKAAKTRAANKRKRSAAAKKGARARKAHKGKRKVTNYTPGRKWTRKGMDRGIKHPGSATKRPRYKRGKKLTGKQKNNLVKWGQARRGKNGKIFLNRPRSNPGIGQIKDRIMSVLSAKGVKTLGLLVVGASGATAVPYFLEKIVAKVAGRSMQLQDGYVGVASSLFGAAVTSLAVGVVLGSDAAQTSFMGGCLVVGIKLIGAVAPQIADKLMLPRVQSRPTYMAPPPAAAGGAAPAGQAGMGMPIFTSPEQLIQGEAMARGVSGFLPMDGFVDPSALAIENDFVPGMDETF